MELDHAFTVAAPVDRAWDTLLDLETIVPCMPGAALKSYDGDEFEGTVKVKIGPVSMTFAGKGRFVERDEGTRRMVIEAAGKDQRGGGTAKATVTAVLASAGDTSTDVKVHTNMAVTGRVAQFGRSMIADVSGRLLGQFTDCLAGKLAGPSAEPAAAGAAAPSAGAAAPSAGGAAGAGAGGAGTAAAGAGAAGTAGGAASAANGRAGAETAAEPATTRTAREEVEVEPVDLLAVTGISGAAKRAIPYAVVFAVGAVAGGIIVRWIGS